MLSFSQQSWTELISCDIERNFFKFLKSLNSGRLISHIYMYRHICVLLNIFVLWFNACFYKSVFCFIAILYDLISSLWFSLSHKYLSWIQFEKEDRFHFHFLLLGDNMKYICSECLPSLAHRREHPHMVNRSRDWKEVGRDWS